MLAAWIAAAFLSGCGPDYIEQAPVLCVETVPVPVVRVYPVAVDAAVSISGRWRSGWHALHLIGFTDCTDYLRRKKLVARVQRCGPELVIQLGRRAPSAPRTVHVSVAGRLP